MKKLYLFSILWINIGFINAQEYKAKVDSARRYITKGCYSCALTEYIKAFSDTTFRAPEHLYEAASMAAIQRDSDLAFMLLNDAIDKGWKNVKRALESRFWPSTQPDPRWEKALARMRALNKKLEPVNLTLDSIFERDQKIRLEYESITNAYKTHSLKSDSLIKQMVFLDSCNLFIVEKIIQEHGVLSNSLGSRSAKMAIPLTLIHSPLKIQEKYLPRMIEAARIEEIDWRHVAYVEDKIMSAKTGKQKFGTQFRVNDKTGERELVPLIDPENVEKYRKEYNLETLEEYKKANQIK